MRLAALAAFVVLALTGCVAEPSTPVSAPELRDIVTSMRVIAWQNNAYNREDRPELGSAPTLPDRAWSIDVIQCFSESGYRVQQVDFRFVYQSGQNQDYREFALTDYRCTNTHPRLGELARSIDRDAYSSLVGYLQLSVLPCLALAGHTVDTSATPETNGSAADLDPFAQLDVSDQERALLMGRCPPVPEWLNLR